MEKELIFTKMVISIRESGWKVNRMEMEFMCITMEMCIKDNGSKARKKGKV